MRKCLKSDRHTADRQSMAHTPTTPTHPTLPDHVVATLLAVREHNVRTLARPADTSTTYDCPERQHTHPADK